MNNLDDTLRLALRTQDIGVRFALQEIEKLVKKNQEVANEGWKDRDTLLKLVHSKISNEYLLKTGVGRDMSTDKSLTLIAEMDDLCDS